MEYNNTGLVLASDTDLAEGKNGILIFDSSIFHISVTGEKKNNGN